MSPETATLTKSLNLIDIRGRGFETLIFSRGKPIAINWHDCAGSVAQYLVRAGVSDYSIDLANLRHLLAGNLNPNLSLAPQFDLFLQLLAPGTYKLVLDSYKVSDLIEPRNEWNPDKDHEHFYPDHTALVLTQPTSSLDAPTIRDYMAQIKSGKRPIALAVATEDSWCAYVIDGHHKLVAYRELNTQPTVLTAYRCSPPPLPRDTFDEWFSSKHPLASHYRNHKAGDA